MNPPGRLVYLQDYLPVEIEFLASSMVPPLTPKTLVARLDKFATKISDGWYLDLPSFERLVRNRFGPKIRRY